MNLYKTMHLHAAECKRLASSLLNPQPSQTSACKLFVAMVSSNPLLLFQTAPLQHALRQEQLYLVLHMDISSSACMQLLVNPGHSSNFGYSSVYDWPIYDGPDFSKAKLVARKRGHNVQTGVDSAQYLHADNIVFLDGSCSPGSTLVTAVTTSAYCDNKWTTAEGTIVGGTGEFHLAQGLIYYDRSGSSVTLHIGVSYTPMMNRSTLSDMFSEFNASEIDDAKNSGTCLGQGLYGSVYKATLRNALVAVKIRNAASSQGEKLFHQEVLALKRIRHENLATIVGVCSNRLALVYEFLPNGTLSDRLENESLSWGQRLQIASSICSALDFLHRATPPIVHGDLKPISIMFDANNTCKISDLGISRLLEVTSDTATTTTTTPSNSDPYRDPEFTRTSEPTPCFDVYSLGIILLQLVTRRTPVKLRENVCGRLEKIKGLSEAMQMEKIFDQLVDPVDLEMDGGSKNDVVKMIRLGLKCTNNTREGRPEMATVLLEIESLKRGASQHQ